MKTNISLLLVLILASLMLSNCMVIADLIEDSKQSTASPNADAQDQPDSLQNAPAGDTPPYLDFPITLLDGETTLRDHQGKTVLMVFFSVNCGHCHNEASHLEAIYQEYKDQGFIIIASEVSGADLATIKEFADQYEITFPIGYEPEYLFARSMEVTGVPHNVLFGTHGEIATIMRGFSDADSLRSSIELHLGN